VIISTTAVKGAWGRAMDVNATAKIADQDRC
jgi:hypothetical protein